MAQELETAVDASGSWEDLEARIWRLMRPEATLRWMIEVALAKSEVGLARRLEDLERRIKPGAGTLSPAHEEFLALSEDFAKTMGYKAHTDEPLDVAADLDYALGLEIVPREVAGLKGNRGVFAFPTGQSLSVRDFNDLSPFPVFPVKLATDKALADGESLHPYSNFGHDLLHLSYMKRAYLEAIAASGGDFATYKALLQDRVRFYRRFRSFVDTLEDRDEREFIEVVWFSMFHEHVFWPVEAKRQMTREWVLKTLRYKINGKYPVVLEVMESKNKDVLRGNYSNPAAITVPLMRKALSRLEAFLESDG